MQKRGCRAPRGARGLKPSTGLVDSDDPRRAPRGARGLKPVLPSIMTVEVDVAPRAGRVD